MGTEHSLRILIADDEDVIRRVLSMHMTRLGHHVDEVSDGEEAFNAISSGSYDLAIVDYRMPKLDGLEVLRKAREAHLDVAIVILTGRGTDETREIAKRLGAVDLLKKPLRLADLERFLIEHFSAK